MTSTVSVEPNSAAKARLVKVSPATFLVSSVSEKHPKIIMDLTTSRHVSGNADKDSHRDSVARARALQPYLQL